jgi:DNA mismatch repair protein MutL
VGRIQVLDDRTINRIAAGEVVERPSSVLKELVENSLDAGATRVDVELRAGGRQLVRVSDDGCGMDRDDALLALERHATSKLRAVEELAEIRTLGFRGEALASIAAVSKLTLATAAEEGRGTEVEVDGGRIRAVRAVGLPRGTSLAVERLFFNTPVRRKFLRSEPTELAHCLRSVTRHALAAPHCGFRLTHGERTLVDAPPVEDVRARLAQLEGADSVGRLLAFEASRDGIRVHGFAGRPAEALPRRDRQHLFVNGRAVTDRTLAHAVARAYGNTVPAGRHAAVFVWVELDAADVDVNVHPQKAEVRFRNAAAIHDLACEAIVAALSRRESVPSLADLRGRQASPEPRSEVREAALRYLDGQGTVRGTPERASEAPLSDGTARAAAGGRIAGAPSSPHAPDRLADVPAPAALAQLHDSYILAADDQALVIVDQHAAHERVLFERYLRSAEAGHVATQRLAFPVTVELGVTEAALLEAELPELRRLGFDVEPFGERTVRIDAVPAVAVDIDPARLLRELVGEAGRARSAATDIAALRLRLVTTASCRAAIKVHHPLGRAAMQHLLDELWETTNPTTCPHGRPVVFRLPLDEIERGFRRR